MITKMCDILSKNSDVALVNLETESFDQQIDSLSQTNKFIVLYTNDNIRNYEHRVKKLKDYEHYAVCTPGLYSHPKHLSSLDTLVEVVDVNKGYQPKFNTAKSFDFLFLPGKNQPWRVALMELLQENQILDNSLWANLWQSDGTIFTPEKCVGLQSPYDLPAEDTKHLSMTEWVFAIYGAQYQDTTCSIVCETSIDSGRIYLTEKTWKPLIAGHPFVAQANPGYYNFLQRLGFRTFSHVWNENHNDPVDIVETCKWIKKQSRSHIVEDTLEVVKHNSQHAMDLSWIKDYHYEQLAKLKIF